MAALLLSLYFIALGSLALLGVHRLFLTWLSFRARRAVACDAANRGRLLVGAEPRVVVQLPLYNEALVVERLLGAVRRLRYPADRLEIQVLDDSTDETRAIVARLADEMRAEGAKITVVRRDTRRGYKSGALARGLDASDAEVVAIFDADFVPEPDFLERVVPVLLSDPTCGMVQARWGHLNREDSLLTRAQAIFLDGHFGIEHHARSTTGRFFNFNGTAGVWRRKAILDAGGWSDDTITEDLDLSYRAQLAGWRFVYLDEVVAPGELPESWAAFRSQQARWVRGSVETTRKHLRRVLADPRLSIRVKIDAAIHLTNNFAYLWMALLALLLPLAVVVRSELGWRVPGGQAVLGVLDLSMLTAGTCAMVIFYAAASVRIEGRLRVARMRDLLFALCLGAGMSLSNAQEVVLGLRSRRSAFVRTPKRGDSTPDVAFSVYGSRSPIPLIAAELMLAAYFLGVTLYAVEYSLFGAMPFLLLYLVGFTSVATGSLTDAWRRHRHTRARVAFERDTTCAT